MAEISLSQYLNSQHASSAHDSAFIQTSQDSIQPPVTTTTTTTQSIPVRPVQPVQPVQPYPPTTNAPLGPSINDQPLPVEAHVEEPNTDSHALAVAHVEEGQPVGAAQLDHGAAEVRDLGWGEDPEVIPNLVGGLPNDELWTLIRRFNKQMYHVKRLDTPPLGGLDLAIADEEEFSPDKLRANIERLYMTVIVGLISFGNHVVRLRSWREENRTMAFMFVYFVAWAADVLTPTIISFLIILIVYPDARHFCFPNAPIALIDTKTGGVKKPSAGVLGSDDSVTGAPEKFKGEAVEQEASNFVNSFTSIAISSATGKHPDGDPHHPSDSKVESAPDPTNIVSAAADANESAAGGNKAHDKTKEPISQAMWAKTRPIMHGIADISDGWERFANALSPTAPFPQERPRLILASALAPLLLVSLFVTPYMVMKANGLFIGVGFFGDPIIWRGLAYLNREFPHWQKLLELRNSLLKGVPTNAQLTITLLRIGEVNKAPLPPPPRSSAPPPEHAMEGAGEDLEHLDEIEGVSDSEIAQAVHPDPSTGQPSTKEDEEKKAPKKKHGRRLLNAIRSTVNTGVETMLGTDRLKAAVGAEHAKNRIGVLQEPDDDPDDGPIEFPARYRGKKGYLYITTTATTPAVSWTSKKRKPGANGMGEVVDPVFTIQIQDIRELKKVGGFGWKTRLLVGWATDREIADGILIVADPTSKVDLVHPETSRTGLVTGKENKHTHDRLVLADAKGDKIDKGVIKMGADGVVREERLLTAISLREELFNRLVSMGNQMWESW